MENEYSQKVTTSYNHDCSIFRLEVTKRMTFIVIPQTKQLLVKHLEWFPLLPNTPNATQVNRAHLGNNLWRQTQFVPRAHHRSPQVSSVVCCRRRQRRRQHCWARMLGKLVTRSPHNTSRSIQDPCHHDHKTLYRYRQRQRWIPRGVKCVSRNTRKRKSQQEEAWQGDNMSRILDPF